MPDIPDIFGGKQEMLVPSLHIEKNENTTHTHTLGFIQFLGMDDLLPISVLRYKTVQYLDIGR